MLCGERMQEAEKKQLVTSVRVDSDLWKEAKVQAIRHDITLTKLVEEAVNLWIQEKITENKRLKKK
jgi:predicted HicB family RNase H-like nuclease